MKLLLIDGHGYVIRGFHALPPTVRSDGMQVGALKAYCEMLWGLLRWHDATHVAVVVDGPGSRGYRRGLYPDYKANRGPTHEDLASQLPLVPEATEAFNVAWVGAAGYEADDVIATYASRAAHLGAKVVIASIDKDMYQLVGGPISIYHPVDRRMIGPDEVYAKLGIYPDQMVDYQALVGDSTDNIPGVRLIGPKKASALLKDWGSLDAIFDNVNRVQPSAVRSLLLAPEAEANARLSRDLARLKSDVPLPEEGIDHFARADPDFDVLMPYLARMEFTALAEELERQEQLAPEPGAHEPA